MSMGEQTTSRVTPFRMSEGRVEYAHSCSFCEEFGFYPNVFKAGPYWTHEHCLIKAVEEGRR